MTVWQTFTNGVRKAFTDAADQYDILAGLHREIGRELVKKNVQRSAARILDVGTGTGYVADKTKFFFPDAMVVGLDIAEGMISKAAQTHEGIRWLQADGQHLPFKDGTFDIIFSNLAYQWMPDLPLAFAQARRVLSGGGFLSGTLFGARTCEELFSCLKMVQPDFNGKNLPRVEDVKDALRQAGFANAKVDYELIKVQFKDARELLDWLKNIGANNLAQEFFLGKQMLQKVDEYYRGHFPYHDGICASFEVVWFDARSL